MRKKGFFSLVLEKDNVLGDKAHGDIRMLVGSGGYRCVLGEIHRERCRRVR